MDSLAKEEFEIKVHAIDESSLMENMQKIANRIKLGLVLATLIVGAALLMLVDSPLTLLGYPLIAIIMFISAALLGFF